MSDLEQRLAKRIALDLGIHNGVMVVDAVRRHHGGVYARGDELTDDQYAALRDVVEEELLGSQPELFE